MELFEINPVFFPIFPIIGAIIIFTGIYLFKDNFLGNRGFEYGGPDWLRAEKMVKVFFLIIAIIYILIILVKSYLIFK